MPRKGITKRADGRYVATVTLSNGTRKHIYGASRKAVLEKVKATETQIAQGVDVSKRLTVNDLFAQWLSIVVSKRNKLGVYEGYKRNIDKHLAPKLGNIALTELHADHIQPIIDAMVSTHAPRTIRNVRAVLRQALNYAIKKRYIPYNPAQHVEIPRIARYEARVFTVGEAQQFLEATRGNHHEVLYHMALLCGLREGELCGMYIKDVDFEKGTISVTGALQRIAGKLRRIKPKTEASADDVPLPITLRDALMAHIEYQLKTYPDNPYLFTSRNGTPVEPRGLLEQFKGVLRRGGLPDMRFHDLRHTTASLLLLSKENIKMVQRQLRHAQVTTTLQLYAHILPDDQRRASENLGDLLSKPLSEE